MSKRSSLHPERAQIILHPTDLSEASDLAFAHALRLAVQNRAYLSILHVNPDGEQAERWDEWPSVRTTLQRWGMLSSDARRSDVADKLGVRVEKVVGYEKDVIESVVGFMRERPIDMIVLATEGREGAPRWLKPSIAEPVARRANVPTLFVPHGLSGCVSLETGQVTLDQVVVPIDHHPSPQPGIERAVRALESFGSKDSTLTLLHVGSEKSAPQVSFPSDIPWKTAHMTRGGDAVEEILNVADEMAANVIVMVTEGRQGFLDALRGTTTEQIIRRAPCPVLAIPFDF